MATIPHIRPLHAVPPAHLSEQMADKAISDSEALRELIDILKKPFQSSCDLCRGSGLSGSGKACSACQGTGRILIDLL